MSIEKAARRVAEREDNSRRSAGAARTIRNEVASGLAVGRKLIKHGRVTLMAFDAAKGLPPAAARDLLDQLAKALGVDPGDAGALKTAFASLLESAGYDVDVPEGTEAIDDGDDEGSEGDGAEGIAPPKPLAVTDPKVVDSRAIDPRVVSKHGAFAGGAPPVSKADIERGRKAFKGGCK